MPQLFRRFSNRKSSDIQIVSHTKTKEQSKHTNGQRADSDSSGNGLENLKEAKCPCCGTLLQFPSDVKRLKCAVCQVTTVVAMRDNSRASSAGNSGGTISLFELQAIVDKCYARRAKMKTATKKELYAIFDPVAAYLNEGFHDIDILNNSFKTSHKRQLIDYYELTKFYELVMDLPTRSPFYRMLCASNDLLKKPSYTGGDFRWILIIWANPSIKRSVVGQKKNGYDAPKILAVGYELTKRCIGYLANIESQIQYGKFLKHLKCVSLNEFQSQVELLNIYITFQFSRILYRDLKASGNQHKRTLADNYPLVQPSPTGNELLSNEDKRDSLDLKNGKPAVVQDFKFKPYEYELNWHIRCAAKLMQTMIKANDKRYTITKNINLSIVEFYNVMLDFIDYRQDFENWRSDNKKSSKETPVTLADFPGMPMRRFTLCSYPFLLSLGVKISIMEHEVRRIMEYEAENAFLASLDKGKAVSVYFKIRVRRSHITNDSLRSIENHQRDLMKSLRVEFVNEPGVDAGGLRKEWFLLLTRSLFNPMNGLFSYVEESRLSWFAISPIRNSSRDGFPSDSQLYYLFGIVIGLAIFNSTILDLEFPRAFYKKLCGDLLNFDDYMQLYPETGQNLIKMLDYKYDDFTDVFALTFEATYEDTNKELLGHKPSVVSVELCHNGRYRRVTQENKYEFVQLWQDFFMNKSVEAQFRQFASGFRQVFVLSDSIKLFNHEELARLVCGNKEKNCFEFQMLRSVTRYVGGFNDKSRVVVWFWEIVEGWDFQLQRKLLQFATGSDRVPPGGMSTLPFKISRLGSKDSDKLPLAHTCFNEVCLWEYSLKEKLEHKLWWAVTQSEGYGFK
ncbi:hypothetical protein ZYGR_0AL01230 [Zygosaccharomyces rouxii]|uniref:HECT-type E3 ubiquitin transferase n=1 Tax=Zygosaccharomyces rouxii TaxID=4956 RepID=A0A1Q3AFE3_ZYGRO|nr:hypothetical protein ZYGR_0AL01230 [Zygosaccharomyces rouxii]